MSPNRDPGESLFLALSVPVPNLPDLTQTDNLALVAEHIERQKLLAQAIQGQADPDDYLDCLSDQGFSVDAYLDAVDDSLIYIL